MAQCFKKIYVFIKHGKNSFQGGYVESSKMLVNIQSYLVTVLKTLG